MSSGIERAAPVTLAAAAALPVLMPLSQPPIVTAVAEMMALGIAGLLATTLGVRAWRTAPLQVAGFPTNLTSASIWPQVLLGGATLAGLVSALIAVLQVMTPDLLQGPLGQWIEPSHLPGRAVGHVRQPNHLATVLLWGAVGWAALHAWSRSTTSPTAAGAKGPADRGTATAIPDAAAAAGMFLLMWALVLSGSRTGLLGLVVLLAWGALDHRLPRTTRALLLFTPVMAGAAWWAMQTWSEATGLAFGASAHLAATSGGDISSSRFAIWRNTVELIALHPWTGVGWGHFNVAWTLTPLPSRPTALFDHAHNLPLHLMVEWGVPLGALACVALAAAVYTAARRAWAIGANAQDPAMRDRAGRDAVLRRSAVVLLAVVLLHSLLEYPLWYVYFGLPAAAALGVAWGLDRPWPRAARWQALALMAGGLMMTAAAASAYADYQLVRVIFAPGPKAAPLLERMSAGQRSTWFADHAHYAVATHLKPAAGQPWLPELEQAFRRAPMVLLDPRLMMAWADALAARGGQDDVDKARHIAARLREFNPPSAQSWLNACGDSTAPSPSPARFRCEPPQNRWTWRDFLREPTPG